MTEYLLPGGTAYQQRIYPNPSNLLVSTGLTTCQHQGGANYSPCFGCAPLPVAPQ